MHSYDRGMLNYMLLTFVYSTVTHRPHVLLVLSEMIWYVSPKPSLDTGFEVKECARVLFANENIP